MSPSVVTYLLRDEAAGLRGFVELHSRQIQLEHRSHRHLHVLRPSDLSDWDFYTFELLRNCF